jgi:hypothetical protein
MDIGKMEPTITGRKLRRQCPTAHGSGVIDPDQIVNLPIGTIDKIQ